MLPQNKIGTFLTRSVDLQFWSDLLAPKWIFCGIAIGFIACCIAGFACTRVVPFADMPRFESYINPYSNYFPTAWQLINYAESKARPDQIIVVVGGNSIFEGMGQNQKELWTKSLQKNLGDKYVVVNYAIAGADPFEGGYYAAEALFKRGHKVLFVTDVEPKDAGFVFGFVLDSMFFDFYNRGLLMPLKAREDMVASATRESMQNHNDRPLERDLAKKMDRITCASDLWNYISYNYFSTMWTVYTRPFWQARKDYTPVEPNHFQIDPNILAAEAKEQAGRDKIYIAKDAAGKWSPIESEWIAPELEAACLAPPAMRDRSCIFITRQNPRMTALMSAEDQERDWAMYQISVAKWKKWGYKATILADDFAVKDFDDITHFSAAGGEKAAMKVADEVRKLARDANYIKEGDAR